jgi:peptide/nickel transport system permease protein
LSRDRSTRWIIGLLAAVHLAALLAEPLAPYGLDRQYRDFAYAPPTKIRFVDASGRFHWRPFVHRLMPDPMTPGRYLEDRSERFGLKLFARGEKYRLLGIWRSDRHLLAVDEPARLFLLGTDGFGRDLFSRLLGGARVSLLAGLLAAALSLGLGGLLGGLSGYGGRATDAVVMRTSEVFMALPWLYLVLAVRAFLPLNISPGRSFFLLVALLGAIGWARPARLVRGVILAAREREFVLAARSFGATGGRILLRHLMPQATGVLATQAAIVVPQYILAEVTLSFLGLGVGEPVPSWGNMLAELQRYHVLVSYGWMFAPAAALTFVVLCYHLLAQRIRP